MHFHCLNIGAINSEKEVVVRQKKALEEGDAVLAPAKKAKTSTVGSSASSAPSNAPTAPAHPMSAPAAALDDEEEAAP